MGEKKREKYIVALPDGRLLLGTKSDTQQAACAKAMMMGIPPGCSVIPWRGK